MNNHLRYCVEDAERALRYIDFAARGLGPEYFSEDGGQAFIADMEMLDPASYLIAHAVELILISYLRVEGIKAGQSDHDLIDRLRRAEAHGLKVNPEFRRYVEIIAAAHKSNQFRYSRGQANGFVSPRGALTSVADQIMEIRHLVLEKALK